MKKKIAKLYVYTLRSGDYIQTRGKFMEYNSIANECYYCAIGVLCELYCKHHGYNWSKDDFDIMYITHKKLIRKWAGLTKEGLGSLICWNDLQFWNFDEIAKQVEMGYKTL